MVQEGKVAGGEDNVFGVIDEAVVLGVEHVVDGRQTNVLIDAAVAGHEMLGQQLVVIWGGRGFKSGHQCQYRHRP